MSTEYAEFLNELNRIFQKEEIPTQKLPQELHKVVQIAKEFGLTWIPQIVVLEEVSTTFGRVEVNKYSETVIELNQFWSFCGKRERTITQMASTLAHELGHCSHMQSFDGDFQDLTISEQEDFADEFRHRIMKRF